MSKATKYWLVYTFTFLSLLVAIVIPLGWGFWGGALRGVGLTVFLYLLPVWVEAYRSVWSKKDD